MLLRASRPSLEVFESLVWISIKLMVFNYLGTVLKRRLLWPQISAGGPAEASAGGPPFEYPVLRGSPVLARAPAISRSFDQI